VIAAWACAGDLAPTDQSDRPDAGADLPDGAPPFTDELDKERARDKFVTTTDLMRYVIAPGCAAENNECHSNEDFPDLHTEGNLWNLVDLRCNLGVGDRTTVEDFCEALGDELRITDGAAAGFTARIGCIELITDEAGEFVEYRVALDRAAPMTSSGASFEIVRNGQAAPALGTGSSLSSIAGDTAITIGAAGDLPAPDQVRQGDENHNGMFGDGTGTLVAPGDARASYLVRRLLAAETFRPQMPLNENSDNPNELNRYLSPDELYAIMSWINCMQPGDGPYSPIRYDCAENAGNDGRW
jgi:hypothetical protein